MKFGCEFLVPIWYNINRCVMVGCGCLSAAAAGCVVTYLYNLSSLCYAVYGMHDGAWYVCGVDGLW